MPSKQETFDTVIAHLRRQKKQAKTRSYCRYRTPDGLKCAAGCLIPDEKYSVYIEGRSIELLDYEPTNAATTASGIIKALGHDLQLVQQLQTLHDCTGNWWLDGIDELEVKKLAQKNDLKYSEIEMPSGI